MNELYSGAAETAGSAFRLGQHVNLLKFRREKGEHDQLGDSVAGMDDTRNIAVVVEGGGILAPVIAVADADAVGGAESLLRG